MTWGEVVFLLLVWGLPCISGGGLYALFQTVNATNSPIGPATLASIDAESGVVKVIGPVKERADSLDLQFSSVTGWPFYAGGPARNNRTYALMQRGEDGSPVVATIDLETGEAVATIEVENVGMFGIIMIGDIHGVAHGATFRVSRSSSYVDVGPFMTNGSIAPEVSFRQNALINVGVAGGTYFGFFQSDMNYQLVDIAAGTSYRVLGPCMYQGQWLYDLAVAPTWDSAGSVDPHSGAPYVLTTLKGNVQLARLNSTNATQWCSIESFSEALSNDITDVRPTGHTALAADDGLFDTLLWQRVSDSVYQLGYLATVDLESGEVTRMKLKMPADLQGAVRQLVFAS